MIGGGEYVLMLFYHKKHQHSASNYGYMKYDHIRGKPAEIDGNCLFWLMKENAFEYDKNNIVVKKPVAEEKNLHIGWQNIRIVKIGNKSKENDYKNKIDTH